MGRVAPVAAEHAPGDASRDDSEEDDWGEAITGGGNVQPQRPRSNTPGRKCCFSVPLELGVNLFAALQIGIMLYFFVISELSRPHCTYLVGGSQIRLSHCST